MWLGVLWVITMLLCVFNTLSFFPGKELHNLIYLLFGITMILTYFSKRRIAYSWFMVISGLCLIYTSIRSMI